MCLHNHETLTERLTVSDSRQGPQKGPVPGHGEHEDPVEGTEGALAETRTIALLDQQEEKPLGRPSGLNPVPGQTAPDHGQTAPDRVQTAPDQVQTDQKEKPLGRPSGLNPLGDIKTATQQAEGKGLRPWMHVSAKSGLRIRSQSQSSTSPPARPVAQYSANTPRHDSSTSDFMKLQTMGGPPEELRTGLLDDTRRQSSRTNSTRVVASTVPV
ncbi:unnamed protein product [Gadus morhua 'NCC']